MAEKRTIKEYAGYAFSFLGELLKPETDAGEAPAQAGIKAASLDDLKLDDLRREKVRLEQEERKMLARLREVEAKKRQLFEEGARNPSDREQLVTARRIKELDVRAGNMDSMLQAISKQMRILNGLIQVKERTRVMAESGISKLLSEIDLGDLIAHIDQSSVDGEFHMEKFNDLIGILEESDSISPEYSEDQDVLEIMRSMQAAREVADSPESLDQRYAEFNRQLAEKDSGQELESFEEDY
jgi:hypothetical protein